MNRISEALNQQPLTYVRLTPDDWDTILDALRDAERNHDGASEHGPVSHRNQHARLAADAGRLWMLLSRTAGTFTITKRTTNGPDDVYEQPIGCRAEAANTLLYGSWRPDPPRGEIAIDLNRARTIRERFCAGEPVHALAGEYRMTPEQVRQVLRHVLWQSRGGAA